jgi:hypothetical protein
VAERAEGGRELLDPNDGVGGSFTHAMLGHEIAKESVKHGRAMGLNHVCEFGWRRPPSNASRFAPASAPGWP